MSPPRKSPAARRIIVSMTLSRAGLLALDTHRGEEPRGRWLERVLLLCDDTINRARKAST
jgi:hypothetical protein